MASDPGLHCLPRSQQWDAMHIWVNHVSAKSKTFSICCDRGDKWPRVFIGSPAGQTSHASYLGPAAIIIVYIYSKNFYA